MNLESFIRDVERKEEQERTKSPESNDTKPLVEWDGKDFRGDRCYPLAVHFLIRHPLIYKYIHQRPKVTMEICSRAWRNFVEFSKVTPEKFLTLDKKAARDLAWEFLEHLGIRTANALEYQKYLKGFYLYHNEERLEFIKGKHDLKYESKKVKEHMSKDVCWRIISKARNLHDETILTCAYECGVRQNGILHLTYGHYKKFLWYNDGTIAVFKVVAQANPDYTHDNKLSGKGISWYYAMLHKEATALLKEYVATYHKDSNDKTPLFLHQRSHVGILQVVKTCVIRARLDPKKVDFHALRRGFKNLIRNTPGITDPEFKEAIQGHKLKGSQEAYFDKDPGEFAREYAKCDFSPSAEIMQEKEKQIQELRERLEKFEQDDWYNQYLKDQQMQGETKPMSMSISPQISGEYFTCPHTKETVKYIDLPCLKNIHYNCEDKVCEKQVMEYIKSWNK